MKFRRGRIGRRAFISSMLSAGVTVPTAMGMASQVLAETPQTGGHLKIGLASGSEIDRLDPALALNDFAATAAFFYGNALTEIGPDGSLRGDLAEEVRAENGGAKWTFTLRKDVVFHNGKSLTSEDVIATLNRLRLQPNAPSVLSALESIEAEGNSRVIVNLQTATPDFAKELANPRFVVLSNGQIGADTGTGPYRVSHFASGKRLSGERNPNYHHSARAFFDSCEINVMPNVQHRLDALMHEGAHVIDRVDPGLAALLDRAPDMRVQTIQNQNALGFTLHGECGKAFDTLSASLDRQDFVDRIFFGHGSVGQDQRSNNLVETVNSIERRSSEAPGLRDLTKALVASTFDLDLPQTIRDALEDGSGIASHSVPANASRFLQHDIVGDSRNMLIPVLSHAINGLSSALKTPRDLANNGNLDGFKAVERWWLGSKAA